MLEGTYLPIELVANAQRLVAKLDDYIHYDHIPMFSNLVHADLTFNSILHASPKLKKLSIRNLQWGKISGSSATYHMKK
ncbi:hypothetical protein A2U01_0019193 [Trifolium medium]|uniref:Uncharacterized protein n=1 Tax=Trifolium medium TaxID=97028 RepID=A0A392NI86_9FABA|nr:hypothetical protein [Trifolium medium]